jgi:hypothetical protein
LWLLPSIIGHTLGLALFINWDDFWANPPIHYTDYALHYIAAEAVNHFLSEGQLWGYSPFFHAGFAEGTVFDSDNKAIEVVTWLLHLMGLSIPHAFNIVIVFLLAVAPFSVWLGTRLARIPPMTAGLAQMLALVLWYGDATINWAWRGGAIAFTATAFASFIVIAAFGEWLAREELARLEAFVWFALGPLLFWLHPWAFFVLAPPMMALWLTRPRWNWLSWFVPILWSGWVIALNWPWLSTLLRFLSTKTPSADFLQGGLQQFLDDVATPYGWLRLIILGMAAWGIWCWRKAGHRQWLAWAVSLGIWIMLAYAGRYLGLGDFQPYRFITPALVAAVVPAAAALAEATPHARSRSAIGFAVVALASLWPLYRAWPRHYLQPDGTPNDYLSGPQPAEHAICTALSSLDLTQGRVLTNDWRLGAYLPECSGAQVIGGPFIWVWTTYGYSNAGVWDFLRHPVQEFDEARMIAALNQYNVHWVVINQAQAPKVYTWDQWRLDHPDFFTPLETHGAFALFAVAHPGSWFARGSGTVRADYNCLEVSEASPGGLVLKYHWLNTLVASRALSLRPVYLGDDPEPFIAIENGTITSFVIQQTYR